MKRGAKLTPMIARAITSDWHIAIPSLAVYKPRWLLRRVGPLLVGVCLDRDSSGEIYKPKFHAHCLCHSQSFIGLSLCKQLYNPRSGGPTFVALHVHNDRYRECASLMISQALLPLSGDLSFTQVERAYINYVNQPEGWSQSLFLMRDLALMAAWSRLPQRAETLMRECLRIPEDILFSPWGGRGEFYKACSRQIEDPSLIDQAVSNEIVAHGLGKLPASHLLPE